jgi:hypothetical protein
MAVQPLQGTRPEQETLRESVHVESRDCCHIGEHDRTSRAPRSCDPVVTHVARTSGDGMPARVSSRWYVESVTSMHRCWSNSRIAF